LGRGACAADPRQGAADMRARVVLDGGPLRVSELVPVGRDGAGVDLGPTAHGRIEEARQVVQHALQSGEAVYGVTTGFGQLSRVRIPTRDVPLLQRNL